MWPVAVQGQVIPASCGDHLKANWPPDTTVYFTLLLGVRQRRNGPFPEL